MHPILARGRRLALYLAAWTLLGLFLAALLVAAGGMGPLHAAWIAIPLALVYSFFCLSAWYVARSTPLGPTGQVRLLTTVLSSSIMSSAAWLIVARGWLQIFVGGDDLATVDRVFPALRALVFGFGVLLYLLSLAVSYLLAAFEQSRDAERRGLEGQLLGREAELRSLRAQIDPHFLFNSLHSISALTTADPVAARRMCVLLADFLRDSLALGSEPRIPVGRELAIAGRYLEIERVRFGERLKVDLQAPGAADCLVPPLLLQPIVENAVTHGVAHLVAGGTIRVEIARGAAALTIVVENPCDPERPRRTGTGLGLANVRARLRALYDDNAHVAAFETGGVWRVEMSLPIDVNTGPVTS
jgi:two-component system, LytTR family, sensor histidine kinase AlgZ